MKVSVGLSSDLLTSQCFRFGLHSVDISIFWCSVTHVFADYQMFLFMTCVYRTLVAPWSPTGASMGTAAAAPLLLLRHAPTVSCQEGWRIYLHMHSLAAMHTRICTCLCMSTCICLCVCICTYKRICQVHVYAEAYAHVKRLGDNGLWHLILNTSIM